LGRRRSSIPTIRTIMVVVAAAAHDKVEAGVDVPAVMIDDPCLQIRPNGGEMIPNGRIFCCCCFCCCCFHGHEAGGEARSLSAKSFAENHHHRGRTSSGGGPRVQ
jgi:hypothetical protein